MRTSFSKPWLLGGFILGVVGLGAIGLNWLAQQRAERMSVALKAAVLDLSTQVRMDLALLVTRVSELGEAVGSLDRLSDLDSGILELSVWEKTESGPLERARLKHFSTTTTASTVSDFEKQVVQKGLEGSSLILGEKPIHGGKMETGVLVVPLGSPRDQPIQRVVFARFKLDRLERLMDPSRHPAWYQEPNPDSRFEASLVSLSPDALFQSSLEPKLPRVILAHSLSPRVGSLSPVQAEPPKLNAEIDYQEASGQWRRARYRSIPLGQLGVIVSAPRAFAELSTHERRGFWSVLLSLLAGGMLVGWAIKGQRSGHFFRKNDQKTESNAESSQEHSSEWRRLAVIHIALWPFDGVISRLSPQGVVELLNEFFQIISLRVQSSSGVLEPSAGGACFAVWSDPLQAMKCAFEIRQELSRCVELRKIEGQPPFTVVMGADWGLGFLACVGFGSDSKYTLIGDLVPHTRSLAFLAPSVQTDLLASHSFWEQIEPAFVGVRAAEANLSPLSGLTACFKVSGYRDEEGRSVMIQVPPVPVSAIETAPKLQEIVPSETRWMVNNGTQIIGPYRASEVAGLLHAVDIDFDCECWREGQGERTTIAQSGMFGGAADTATQGMDFWIFDGKTIHGPMTEGFLKTAVSRKAVSIEDYFCRASTVSGWKRISDFIPAEEGRVTDPANPEAA